MLFKAILATSLFLDFTSGEAAHWTRDTLLLQTHVHLTDLLLFLRKDCCHLRRFGFRWKIFHLFVFPDQMMGTINSYILIWPGKAWVVIHPSDKTSGAFWFSFVFQTLLSLQKVPDPHSVRKLRSFWKCSKCSHKQVVTAWISSMALKTILFVHRRMKLLHSLQKPLILVVSYRK